MMRTAGAETAAVETSWGIERLWKRELAHYPKVGTRAFNLAIVVATTVLFYYQYYVISGVGDQVMAQTHMSFMYFINVNVISALLSAFTSAAGGVADRFGRANIICVGVLGCALVCLIGIPTAHTTLAVMVWYAILGAIEGVVLVATPALVRDFSPQLGRATAMGFWTIGPVAGSLITSLVITHTIDHMTWQGEYAISGWVGIGVFVLALLFLRELSPGVRDQVIVSDEDIALAEARARGIDIEKALEQPFKQIMRPDLILSSFAISVYLFMYVAAISVFPIFFQTIFGYSTAQANNLGNWMWGFQTVALIVVGLLSDKLQVRKPFMMVGAIGTVFASLAVIHFTGNPSTSFDTWIVVLTVLSIFIGLTFAPWMATFTETVERHNPALTATGLSLWGLILRTVVAAVVFANPYIVNTVTTLVEHGPSVQALASGTDPTLTRAENAAVAAVVADPAIGTRVQTLSTKYAAELATAGKLDAQTQTALSTNPSSQAAIVSALSEISGISPASVARAETLSSKYASELATMAAIDPATQQLLLANPADQAAQQKAVGEIAQHFGIGASPAAQRLGALGAVPSADLAFLATTGDKVQTAANQLTALGKVPSADMAFVSKYAALGDPKVQSKLAYLQRFGPKVQQAAKDSPGQWQTYFWIAVGGQLVFIPLVFLLAGYWNPRRARRELELHRAKVDAELRSLGVI